MPAQGRLRSGTVRHRGRVKTAALSNTLAPDPNPRETRPRQVEELHDFSARSRRADPRRSRCFRSVLLCDPSPALNATTGRLRPFAAAQWVRRLAFLCPHAADARSEMACVALLPCKQDKGG